MPPKKVPVDHPIQIVFFENEDPDDDPAQSEEPESCAIREKKENRRPFHLDTIGLKKITEKIGPHPITIIAIATSNSSSNTKDGSHLLSNMVNYLTALEKRGEDQTVENSSFDENPAKINDQHSDLWVTTSTSTSDSKNRNGIWMWSKSFLVRTKSGENSKLAVLLMNVQGCFDTSLPDCEQSAILGLTLLTSSCFLVTSRQTNGPKTVTVDSLTSLARFMDRHGYPDDEKMVDSEFSSVESSQKEKQKLLLVIQDWTESNGLGHIELDILPDSLSSLQKNFEPRTCYFLPPMTDEFDVDFSAGKLNQNFETHFDQLMKNLVGSLTIKKIGAIATPVTGTSVQALFSNYLKAFNKTDNDIMPSPVLIAKATMHTMYDMITNFEKNYEDTLSNKIQQFPYSLQEDLVEMHNQVKTDIMHKFDDVPSIDPKSKSIFADQLKTKFETIFGKLSAQLKETQKIVIEVAENLGLTQFEAHFNKNRHRLTPSLNSWKDFQKIVKEAETEGRASFLKESPEKFKRHFEPQFIQKLRLRKITYWTQVTSHQSMPDLDHIESSLQTVVSTVYVVGMKTFIEADTGQGSHKLSKNLEQVHGKFLKKALRSFKTQIETEKIDEKFYTFLCENQLLTDIKVEYEKFEQDHLKRFNLLQATLNETVQQGIAAFAEEAQQILTNLTMTADQKIQKLHETYQDILEVSTVALEMGTNLVDFELLTGLSKKLRQALRTSEKSKIDQVHQAEKEARKEFDKVLALQFQKFCHKLETHFSTKGYHSHDPEQLERMIENLTLESRSSFEEAIAKKISSPCPSQLVNRFEGLMATESHKQILANLTNSHNQLSSSTSSKLGQQNGRQNGQVNPNKNNQWYLLLTILLSLSIILVAIIPPQRLTSFFTPNNVKHGKSIEITKQQLPTFLFDVREPSDPFCARDFFLCELDHVIQSHLTDDQNAGGGKEKNFKQPLKLTIVTGLSGVGKTETVRSYISRYAHSYSNVIWIQATSKMTLHDSFNRLAQEVKASSSRSSMGNSHLENLDSVPPPPAGQSKSKFSLHDLVKRTYAAIFDKNPHGSTLLVFDDAFAYDDDTGEGVQNFFPVHQNRWGNVSILVTSKNVDWSIQQSQILILNPFTIHESIDCIQLQLGRYLGDKETKLLAQQLSGIPGKVQESVAMIKQDILSRESLMGTAAVHKYLNIYDGIEEQRAIQIMKVIPNSYSQIPSIELDLTALNFVLDKVGDRHFVVLSINGACRTGKSFLLNYFLRYLKFQHHAHSLLSAVDGTGAQDFNDMEATWRQSSSKWFDTPISQENTWRSGLNRETIGVNLWSEPFIVKTGDDQQEVAILLVDSQGLFDDQTSPKENTQIFTLSTLLSSVMIYNVMRQLDESVLGNLADFTRHARIIAEDQKVPPQSMMVLIRDFAFFNEFAYGFHDHETQPFSNPQNYYHRFLDKSVRSESLGSRRGIVGSFEKFGFYLLPGPGQEFLQTSAPSNLHPDFKRYLKQFITLMLTDLKNSVKKVDGRKVTGKEFQKHVQSWPELLNVIGEDLSDLQLVGENLISRQNERARDLAFEQFVKNCQAQLGNLEDPQAMEMTDDVSMEELKLVYKNLFNAAMETFRKSSQNSFKTGGNNHNNGGDDEEEGEDIQQKLFSEQAKYSGQLSKLCQKEFTKYEQFYQPRFEENEKFRTAIHQTWVSVTIFFSLLAIIMVIRKVASNQ